MNRGRSGSDVDVLLRLWLFLQRAAEVIERYDWLKRGDADMRACFGARKCVIKISLCSFSWEAQTCEKLGADSRRIIPIGISPQRNSNVFASA